MTLDREKAASLMKCLCIAFANNELGIAEGKLKDGREVLVIVACPNPSDIVPLAVIPADVDLDKLPDLLEPPGEAGMHVMRAQIMRGDDVIGLGDAPALPPVQ